MLSKKLTKRSLTSEMDQSIKRMLKLIEEDADSFAKKADMYYQKRPVLISHVEEFYRMYRSLAERYDTGELRKNIPSDLQSQGSVSDFGSEPSSCTWPSPDKRIGRRQSGPRAAGFEFFLGSGGRTCDSYQKEGDRESSSSSSSLTDSSQSDSDDDSSVNNYSSGDQGLNRKMIELEIELREVKEKLQVRDKNVFADGSFKDESYEDCFARMARYKEELRIAQEKLRISQIQITRLKSKLKRYKKSKFTKKNCCLPESVSCRVEDTQIRRQDDGVLPLEFVKINQESKLQEQCGMLDLKVEQLVEELQLTRGRLEESQKEVANLKHQLENSNRLGEEMCHLQDEVEIARKDTATWKAKLNAEKREVSKLQERITRLKTSLSDRDDEIMDLKIAVSDAEQKLFAEKAKGKAEVCKLVEELREWEHGAGLLNDEIKKVKKGEEEEEAEDVESETEELKTSIVEKVKDGVVGLRCEREELNAQIMRLKEELNSKNRQMEELRLRKEELEEENEQQREMIIQGAEQKREAIRQLCFSIEHYKNLAKPSPTTNAILR